MKDVKSFHVVGVVGGKATASSFSLSLSATGGGGDISVPGATLKIVVAAGTRVHQGQRSELAEIDREPGNGADGGQPLDKSTCKQQRFFKLRRPDHYDGFRDRVFPRRGHSQFRRPAVPPRGTGQKSSCSPTQRATGCTSQLPVPRTCFTFEGKSSQDSLTFSDFGDARLPAVPSNAISLPGT